MLELSSFFAESELQLISRKSTTKVEHIMQLVSDINFDADELRRRVKKNGDCKRILNDGGDEELAREGFTKKIVKGGSGLSASATMLYKKNISAVLRRRMATGPSRDMFFSPQDISDETEHPGTTLYGRSRQREVHGRVTASRAVMQGGIVKPFSRRGRSQE